MDNYILENALEDVCYNNCSNYCYGDCEGWNAYEIHDGCPFQEEMQEMETRCKQLLGLIDEVSKSAKNSSVKIMNPDNDSRYYPENEPFNPFFVPYWQRKAL